MPHQSTGINTVYSDHTVLLHPFRKGLLAAPVARLRGQLPHDQSTGMRLIRLLVIWIDTRIANLWVRKSDELT